MTTYYESLPIFKSAMDLVKTFDGVVRPFPRYHKYAIGARFREQAANVVVLVARASRASQRAAPLGTLCEACEELKLQVNMGKEVEAFEGDGPAGNVRARSVAWWLEPLPPGPTVASPLGPMPPPLPHGPLTGPVVRALIQLVLPWLDPPPRTDHDHRAHREAHLAPVDRHGIHRVVARGARPHRPRRRARGAL